MFVCLQILQTKMFGLSPKCKDKHKNKYLKFIHSGVSFMLTNAQRKVDKFVLEPYEKLSLWATSKDEFMAFTQKQNSAFGIANAAI